MKNKFLVLVAALSCMFASCVTYNEAMSDPSNNPVREKLPRMDIDWYGGGNIQGVNVDFVKNIIRGEINQNITSSTGQKSGKIEVNCERIRLSQNLGLAYLSGLSLFSLNILGMPITITDVDMTLSFKILTPNDEVIESYRYSTNKTSPVALYYGKVASVVVVDATKDIMNRFRNDINSDSEKIISKLRSGRLVKNEPYNQVEGLGTTSLEQQIVRWDVNSRPAGADLYWRVVSKTPEVKSTNKKYLTTTPYEATKSLDIKGLTYQNSGNVRIILTCEKEGYLPQEKEYDVRMIIDQEEISAFFKLVKEE